MLFKKSKPYKPDSVPLAEARVSIIYLGLPSLASSSSLPVAVPANSLNARRSGVETSSLLVSATYLTFQPPGFTAMHVTIQSRGLLPHIFTLTSPEARRYIFCGTFRIAPRGATLPVRKRGALRCPDFPLSHRSGTAIEQVCHVQRYVIKPYLCLP